MFYVLNGLRLAIYMKQYVRTVWLWWNDVSSDMRPHCVTVHTIGECWVRQRFRYHMRPNNFAIKFSIRSKQNVSRFKFEDILWTVLKRLLLSRIGGLTKALGHNLYCFLLSLVPIWEKYLLLKYFQIDYLYLRWRQQTCLHYSNIRPTYGFADTLTH